MSNETSPAKRELDLAFEEYFQDKPVPATKEERKKQLKGFEEWYNNIRKQSDTGKTPNEMWKEIYGEDAPEHGEEDIIEGMYGIAEEVFDNDIWKKAKVEMKDLSKKELAKAMFTTGFIIHQKVIEEQLRKIEKGEI